MNSSLLRALFFVGIFAFCATRAPAQTFPAASVTASALPNGLRLVVKRSPGDALTAIQLWVRSGSRNETASNNGVAHLLEHYLFQGKPGDSADPFDHQIEGLGGTLNAETSRDDTHYYVTVPGESFLPALRLLAQMIQHPSFNALQLDIEHRRAADEVEQRTDDAAFAAQQALFALAYKKSPYRLPIAGTPDTIMKLTLDQVRAFYNTNYRPDNATLVIVGDVTLDQVKTAAAAAWGGWAKPAAPIPPVVQEPNRDHSPPARLIALRAPTPQGLIAVGYPAPAAQSERDAVTMDVIYTLLTSGQRSLLSEQLSKPGLLSGLGSDFLTSRDPGLFVIWGYAPVGKIKAVRQKIEDVVGEIAAGTFSDAALARARQSLVGSYNLENETTSDQATDLGFYDSIVGYEYAIKYDSVAQSITRADLMRVAHRYFRTVYTVVLAPAGTPI